jgi:hypothetical protein
VRLLAESGQSLGDMLRLPLREWRRSICSCAWSPTLVALNWMLPVSPIAAKTINYSYQQVSGEYTGLPV